VKDGSFLLVHWKRREENEKRARTFLISILSYLKKRNPHIYPCSMVYFHMGMKIV